MLLAFSLSLTHSAIMSEAPDNASDVSLTSPLTNFIAIISGDDSDDCDIIILAKGSSPRALAACARVLRFGLYGKKMSSSTTGSRVSSILDSISAVRAFCSRIT